MEGVEEVTPGDAFASFLGDDDGTTVSRDEVVVPSGRNWFRQARKDVSFTLLAITSLFFLGLVSLLFRLNTVDGIESFSASSVRPDRIWQWNEADFAAEFDDFVKVYNRVYDGEEKKLRYNIFKRNLTVIYTHNEGHNSFSMKINKFGDWTLEEFRKHLLGQKKPPNFVSSGTPLPENEDDNTLPKSVDWREMGCVAPPKDQGRCGSCWAFSAVGALESAYCIATGKLLFFSEQQLVDCSAPELNQGCNGGLFEGAWQYYVDNGRHICSEEEYKYMAVDGVCKDHACTHPIPIESYFSVRKRSEISLKHALAHHGPVSVSLNADSMAFMFYHKGVFASQCNTSLDHAVLAIGYGTDEMTGTDFWLIKNSWGTNWGDGGFIRIAMHKGPAGECGILLDPAFPIIKVAPHSSRSFDTAPPTISY